MMWWVGAVMVVMACGEPQRGTTPAIANAIPVDAARPDGAPVVPDPVQARVIHVELIGGDAILTLNRGSSDGVAKRWKAALVDEHGKLVSEAVLIRIDKHTTVIKAPVTIDAVYASPTVKLWTDEPDPDASPKDKLDL